MNLHCRTSLLVTLLSVYAAFVATAAGVWGA